MEIIMSIMIMQITELLHNLLLVVPNVRDLKVEHQALEMLLELLQDLMARDVLTRLKWWRRLSMMMLSSVTIAMTRDVTQLMSPTTSLNRKRTVKRTSEKPVVKDCDTPGEEICRTEYESECWTKQEVHDVEDDVVECRTEVEEKCEDETSGYTTNTKCSKWPKEV